MIQLTGEMFDNHVNKLNIYEYQLIRLATEMINIPQYEYNFYGTKFLAVISPSVGKNILKCRALITLVLRARNYTYEEICKIITVKRLTWAGSRLNNLQALELIRNDSDFFNSYKNLIAASDEFYIKSPIYEKKLSK
jgi:hypothetical protein